MPKKITFSFILILFLITCAFYGQKKDLSLEKIYSSRTFQPNGFGPIRWLEDGSGYTTVETSEETGWKDIVKYNLSNNERTVLISAEMFIPKGQEKPLNVRNYTWSNDGEKLLIFTNTRRVWRYHTRGDYWVLNLKTKKLQQLGKTLKSTTLQFAKFSNDSKKAAYVSEQNIYVEDLETNEITALTTDGSDTIIT